MKLSNYESGSSKKTLKSDLEIKIMCLISSWGYNYQRYFPTTPEGTELRLSILFIYFKNSARRRIFRRWGIAIGMYIAFVKRISESYHTFAIVENWADAISQLSLNGPRPRVIWIQIFLFFYLAFSHSVC